MKLSKFCLILAAFSAVAFTGCKHEDLGEQHYDNKLYVSSDKLVDNLLIDINNTDDDTSRSISLRIAKPETQDITVTFEAKPSLAAQYNMIYGDNAEALPAEHFSIPELTSIIKAGKLFGDDITVNFTGAHKLDKSRRYVLPVTIANTTNIGVLESCRTVYFVFKGAALINVVANIKQMYFTVGWANSAVITNMKTITIEALIRCKDWADGRKYETIVSSMFGIEGRFLIRIGDADRPLNQLQLVAPGGNWPAPNAAPGIGLNEWIHIAVVYDAVTKERIYYQNGQVVASDMGATGSFSLGGCNIGYSYDDTRWFPVDISEFRVWNIQRSAAEIAENPYYIEPETPGLIAYWKFNEGAGNIIKDRSGNGSDLIPKGTPTWIPVELGAAE